jgi:hypothetical protein
MRWVRRWLRPGAALALWALALQLWLGFGHIHAEDVAPAPQTTAAAAQQDGTGHPALPGDHDDCPICSVMHLAGAVVLPAPPALAALEVPRFTLLPAAHAAITFAAAPSAFNARAPPTA